MTVISVEHLSKAYRLGQIGTGTLSRDLNVWWAKVRGKPNPVLKVDQKDHRNRDGETIWALKDVSFEVKQGEVLGIIGRNGAGKSTLLKILTGVTAPTGGQIKAKGRVASLLEVGTGFHPELTGRENIYLNGAILGMKKAEIARKFDEIVAFSEVEQFIDTPVKRYSSGMYVRLAFAVAAHLDPEILLVDEVLAVGDAAFQKKCLGKMGDVAKGGRTVLFVSHNMAAAKQLCGRCLLLGAGILESIGQTSAVVQRYLTGIGGLAPHVDLQRHESRSGHQGVRFVWARVGDGGEGRTDFSLGDSVVITFAIEAEPIYVGRPAKFAVTLTSSDGLVLAHMVDEDSGFKVARLEPSLVLSVCLQDIRLYPDTYRVTLWVGSTNSLECYDSVESCVAFAVTDGGQLTTRRLPSGRGRVFLTPRWQAVSKEPLGTVSAAARDAKP